MVEVGGTDQTNIVTEVVVDGTDQTSIVTEAGVRVTEVGEWVGQW